VSAGTEHGDVLDFAIRVDEAPDAVVVMVAGDIDHIHFRELEAAIDHRLAGADGPVHLVVDLTEVPYCDSCGMRVLLGASQRATAAGGTFRLRGVHGQPGRALRLTGLERVLCDAGRSA
jgi:anti-sigma B factor antagonist